MAVVTVRNIGPVVEWKHRDVRLAYDRQSGHWSLIVPARGFAWERGNDAVVDLEGPVIHQMAVVLDALTQAEDWQEWQVTARHEDPGVSYSTGEMTLELNTEAELPDIFTLVAPSENVVLDKALVAVVLTPHNTSRLASICRRFEEVRNHG